MPIQDSPPPFLLPLRPSHLLRSQRLRAVAFTSSLILLLQRTRLALVLGRGGRKLLLQLRHTRLQANVAHMGQRAIRETIAGA